MHSLMAKPLSASVIVTMSRRHGREMVAAAPAPTSAVSILTDDAIDCDRMWHHAKTVAQ